MNILKEMEDVKEFWRCSHFIFKTIYLISFFLTISSITSLADEIFAWKGFILDGVEFYRAWIVSPVIDAARNAGISWSENQANFIIMMTVLMTSLARLLWLVIPSRELKWVKPLIVFIPIASLIIDIVTVTLHEFFINNTAIAGIPIFDIIYPALYIKAAIVLAAPQALEVTDVKILTAFYAPLFTTAIFVCLLGAINQAFTR